MFATQEGESANTSAENLKLQQEAQAAIDATRIGQNFAEDVIRKGIIGMDPKSIQTWFSNTISSIVTPTALYDRVALLDAQSAKIRNVLGLGAEKTKEFTLLIADNASRFAEFGFTVNDVVETYTDLASTFNTNVTVSNETLTQLKTTAAVTAVDVKSLAANFRGVGVDIGTIPEKMLEVVNVARDSGVAVSAVSKGVVDNLDKMNIYNFEGGVKGLAKMSTQAAKLGIDMSKIFGVVDKVFNPEGAIELAAGLQRLGVATGELLDPLRLMDLAQNDPTELQNQIVNMTKDFVRFNKELGQFEILPGEKRRLNEIGKELGYSNGELQKMAINAANLEFKMKQIKFPSSVASKEDRELIATLATVNKEGIAEVKVRKFDAEGKDTGTYEIVEASQLTEEQIKKLREEQDLQNESMEEIAKQSLTEQKRLSYLMEQIATAAGYGFASSQPVADFYTLSTKTVRENLFKEEGRGGGLIGEPYNRTKTYREGADYVYTEMKELLTQMASTLGIESFSDLGNKITEGFSSLGEGFENLTGLEIPDMSDISGAITNIGDYFKSFGTGGSETDPLTKFTNSTENINNSIQNVVTQLTNVVSTQPKEFKPIDINEKIEVTLNVNLDPNSKNQALSDLMTRALEEYFNGGQNNTNIKMILDEMNKNKANQGITPVNTTTSLVSAPGASRD
jgi:hypothetical protein